jgi:hypothetical protein
LWYHLKIDSCHIDERAICSKAKLFCIKYAADCDAVYSNKKICQNFLQNAQNSISQQEFMLNPIIILQFMAPFPIPLRMNRM